MTSALQNHIERKYGIRLSFSTSPADFAATVMVARRRLDKEGIPTDGLPIFGNHINPDLSYIAPGCFFATCGFNDSGLVSTNTGRLYRFDAPQSIRWLMESIRLWADDPDVTLPEWSCEVTGDDPRLDVQVPAIWHFGTAWIHPSERGKGLGREVVALNRAKSFETLGDYLGFGTTLASKNGKWTGKEPDATAILHITNDYAFRPASSEHQQIRIWTRESNEAVVRELLELRKVTPGTG